MENENLMLTGMSFDELILGLSEGERDTVRGYMAGLSLEELGLYSEHSISMLAHKIAALGGVHWHCNRCHTDRPAGEFPWSNPRLCLKCEAKNPRQKRRQIEVWLEAIAKGETMVCVGCEQDLPRQNFSAAQRKCRACIKAKKAVPA